MVAISLSLYVYIYIYIHIYIYIYLSIYLAYIYIYIYIYICMYKSVPARGPSVERRQRLPGDLERLVRGQAQQGPGKKV